MGYSLTQRLRAGIKVSFVAARVFENGTSLPLEGESLPLMVSERRAAGNVTPQRVRA